MNLRISDYPLKVGGSSSAVVNFNNWANAPVKATTVKNKKTKEIVNEIFLRCAEVTSDPFWAEKFRLAAIGKFPNCDQSKFTYTNGTLTHKKGTKTVKLVVSSDPRQAAEECKDFFRVNRSIYSPTDENLALEKKFARSSSLMDAEELSWEKANKKIRECLISHFVNDQSEAMRLTSEQSKQLNQLINVCLFRKYFDKNNIFLVNDRIYNITGLMWDVQNEVFYIDPNMKPSVTRSYAKKSITNNYPKDSLPQFNTKWNKYLDKYVDKIETLKCHHPRDKALVKQGFSLNSGDLSACPRAGVGSAARPPSLPDSRR